MELARQVEEILKKPVETSKEQAEQISSAVRLVDALVTQGLIVEPTYRLAPMAVPSKVFARSR